MQDGSVVYNVAVECDLVQLKENHGFKYGIGNLEAAQLWAISLLIP